MSAAVSFLLRLVLLMAIALSGAACVSGRHSMSVAVGEEHARAIAGGVGGASAAASDDGDAVFQLLCWNIHKAEDPDFPEELGAVLAEFPVNDQVILCLQETRSNTLAMLPPESVAGLSGHYAESWRYPLSKRSTGVITAGPSALRPLWGQRLRSQYREFFVTSPKVCLRSEMETKDGRSLLVLNCHGLNFVTSSMLARQLDLVFDPLTAGGRDAERAVVVCGDFNVWSDDRLAVLNSRVKAAGLVEVGVPDHRGPDTTVWLNVVAPLVKYDSAIPLDRIYVRGVDVLECSMVEGTRSSDHAPLAMRFRLEE